MNDPLEKRFEEIARRAIEDAEHVKCDGKDFVEGLKIIVSEVRHRLECAAEEFGSDL